MTEPTPRIHWEDKTPRNSDVYNVASIGYVGTINESAFLIYTPDEMHDNWLLSVRLTPGSQLLYAASMDEAKDKAERWLEEFTASLGATFPDEPAIMFADVTDEETLRAQFAPGGYVRYSHPDAGYPGEQDEAREILVLGALYGIARSDIGQSRTDLSLVGIEGRFNSVLFEPVTPRTSASVAADSKEHQ